MSFPESFGFLPCIHALAFPPRHFITAIMQRPVVCGAKRNNPLVARLSPHGARLHKSQMMRFARMPTANQARLLSDVAKMILIPNSPGDC